VDWRGSGGDTVVFLASTMCPLLVPGPGGSDEVGEAAASTGPAL
jgi:hypothetical protein